MVEYKYKYELITTMQAPGDTIKWFHRVFLAQLATSRAHEGMPGYHPVLVEHHLTLLMAAVGVTTDMTATMTSTTNMLAHVESMATMRE